MKCTIPEISWHNRDPVLTADIQRSSTNPQIYRLATGGTDTHVVIWQLCILENGAVSVEMLSDLTRHSRAVNVVRFSPDGSLLASADDEAAIILWKCNENLKDDIFADENERENKENWTQYKVLRSHIEDVYDLCWSECSQFLISGSVDNSAILWDIPKHKHTAIFKDHKGFVQGVAWDPKGKFAATLCSDRCMRVYNIKKGKVVCKTQKAILSSQTTEENPKATHLFYDDTLKSFCRRLAFSPDGELIIAPSGILEDADGKYINVTHVFSRTLLNRPVMCYPSQDKFTIAVRFCPMLFELHKNDNCEENKEKFFTNLFNLPYRMIFAVATQNSVLIYDTQQQVPFAKIAKIHYTRLSDLSWSSDGRLLVVSSTDGYCSLISFNEGELGVPYCASPQSESNNDDTSAPDKISTTQESPKSSQSSKEQSMEVDGVSPLAEATQSPHSTKKRIPFTTLCSSSPKQKPPQAQFKVAMPIAVRRKNGGKPVKRVQLTTLSTKVEERPSTSGVSRPPPSKEAPQTDDQSQSKPEESVVPPVSSPSAKVPSGAEVAPSSPSQALKQGPKTPRRVNLITLSSPKSNKKILKDKS